MPRIMAFDAGAKRTGIAVSDPMKMIATALDTIDTEKVISFITSYLKNEPVEAFVVGYPLDMQMRETDGTRIAMELIEKLRKHFPAIPVHQIDERFTSSIAQQTLVQAGYKKKQRQDKTKLDKISAVLILQSYLERHP